jgi:hypothetical protein
MVNHDFPLAETYSPNSSASSHTRDTREYTRDHARCLHARARARSSIGKRSDRRDFGRAMFTRCDKMRRAMCRRRRAMAPLLEFQYFEERTPALTSLPERVSKVASE